MAGPLLLRDRHQPEAEQQPQARHRHKSPSLEELSGAHCGQFKLRKPVWLVLSPVSLGVGWLLVDPSSHPYLAHPSTSLHILSLSASSC